MKISRMFPVLGALAILTLPAVAQAHVEVSSGGDGLVLVSVPNESQTADTVEVSVQLPDNVLQAEFPKVTGWSSTGATEPLTPALVIGGSTVRERVTSVTWTGGKIAPGKRAEFRLRVRVRTGTQREGLAFPAVQRYSDGTVVRWIGPAGSAEPAGVLADALPVVAATPAPVETTSAPTNPPATTTDTAPGDAAGDDGGFPPVALIIVVAVAIVGGAAFGVISKRRRG